MNHTAGDFTAKKGWRRHGSVCAAVVFFYIDLQHNYIEGCAAGTYTVSKHQQLFQNAERSPVAKRAYEAFCDFEGNRYKNRKDIKKSAAVRAY